VTRGSAFTLDALVRSAAETRPDAPAVVAPDGTLTYAELERAASGLAATMLELGVRHGDRVAVWAPKSARTVAVLYGVMRAGAAYVPLDPLVPPPRARQVIDDAGCALLWADSQRLERLGDGSVRALDVEAAELAGDASHVGSGACEADLAYILYTSGSTGTPKGVMLTHRNALAFVEWTVGRFGVGGDDRVVSHAPFHFDLSVFDLYGSALAGAALHLLPPGAESMGADMAAEVKSRSITTWYSVPSALVMLAGSASPEDLASLRTVLFAGEVFPMKHLRRLRELVPQAQLANLYGPTETNVCTYFAVDGELPPGDDPLPIGSACENQSVFALDEQLRPVSVGEEGELWVRGPTVMKGYWGRPEETSKTLRQNPLHDLFPDPAYGTGDLVRCRADGHYEFIGRRDHQVKSRGYRIELGDIEAVLNRHPQVREAAVVAVDDERIGARLVGFASASGELDELELRRHCAEALPRYMVPGSITVEERLPHTSTGKIDRQELESRAR
jgi:amino acid adenylation domain-containing protein